MLVGSGTVVATNDDGTTMTRVCAGGEVIPGVFSAVALVSLADSPPTTEQRERSARIFADKLGLRVVGVSCSGIDCTITYDSGEGVRAIGATCGAESCTGDP